MPAEMEVDLNTRLLVVVYASIKMPNTSLLVTLD